MAKNINSKMDIHSKRKFSSKKGSRRKMSDEDKNRKVPRSFSIREIVLDQFQLAQDNFGINQSAVMEIQIINYLRRIKLWPPRLGEHAEIVPKNGEEK